MSKWQWGIIPCLLIVCACFGVDRRGGITKYKNGTAYTGWGSFQVPQLPPPWKAPRRLLKQLVYENDPLKATIVVDALCGAKYDDAPLNRLGRELFQRLQNAKIETERTITLDGRNAYRADGRGEVDGVPLRMSAVVLKKNFCLYDFSYFAPPENFAGGLRDFEDYLHGFQAR